jgi:hypothetical protein
VLIWFRGTFPRFRYDQLMNIGWKIAIPVGMAAVVINALLGMIGPGAPGALVRLSGAIRPASISEIQNGPASVSKPARQTSRAPQTRSEYGRA